MTAKATVMEQLQACQKQLAGQTPTRQVVPRTAVAGGQSIDKKRQQSHHNNNSTFPVSPGTTPAGFPFASSSPLAHRFIQLVPEAAPRARSLSAACAWQRAQEQYSQKATQEASFQYETACWLLPQEVVLSLVAAACCLFSGTCSSCLSSFSVGCRHTHQILLAICLCH